MLRTPCLTLGKQNQICLPKDIKEQKQPKELISPATAEAEGNSTSNAGNKPSAKVSASYPLWVLEEKKKYPEAQDHPLWQKFAKWCSTQRDYRRKPGKPIAKGFWTWLSNLPEPLRDRVKTRKDEPKIPYRQRENRINLLNRCKAALMRQKQTPEVERQLERIQTELHRM